MFLIPHARKLLKIMKKTQCALSCFVVIGDDYRVYHATGSSMEDAENSMKSKINNMLPKDYQDAIYYLKDNALIVQVGWSSIYQVTYKGWYNSSLRKHEILHTVVTHFLFPSLVAFVTTLLSLLFLE